VYREQNKRIPEGVVGGRLQREFTGRIRIKIRKRIKSKMKRIKSKIMSKSGTG
jgi:hypothetical protein